MAWTPPRRVTSAATTITINAAGLPAWLPSAGSWAQVSLNTAASVKGNHTNFSSARDLDNLFVDFTGVVWNPYIGTHGAYLVHGGGHQQYLGNEVYAWSADTRQWSRLTDPTYPGTNSSGTSLVSLGDWTAYKEPPYGSDYLQTYGELAFGVPASNHSRWLPCILPPSLGGSAQGDYLLPAIASYHTGGNGLANQGHRLDCSTNTWSRLGGLNTVTGAGSGGGSACVDTTRGDVWLFAGQKVSKMSAATGVFSDVTPSGYYGSGFESRPAVYLPSVDRIVLFNASMQMRVINPASPSLVTPTVSGTPPTTSAGESHNGVYCADLGTYGSVVSMDFTNKIVKALAIPAGGSGTWAWTTLSASNTPSYGDAQWWYHRLQYAPSLKSFFIATLAEGALNTGGMWCFRPSEIP